MSKSIIEKREEFVSLQVIRTVAFLNVLFFHCDAIRSGGSIGVELFLLLSGFLMTYHSSDALLPCTAKDSFQFSLRKIRRLYPLYIMTTFIMILMVIQPLEWYKESMNMLREGVRLTLAVTLLQAWIPASSVYFAYNGVAWFLSAYFAICFFSPFLIRIIKKINSIRSYLLVIVSITILEYLFGYWTYEIEYHFPGFSDESCFGIWFTYIFPLFRMLDVSIGCCICCIFLMIRDRIQIKIGIASLIEGFSLILLFFFELFARFKTQIPYYTIIPITVFISALSIFVFALNRGRVSEILANRLVLFIGQFSSYAFLIHPVVIILVDKLTLTYFNRNLPPWPKAFVVLTITLFFSEVFHLLEASIKRRRYKNGE